jgi:hypothetical protein
MDDAPLSCDAPGNYFANNFDIVARQAQMHHLLGIKRSTLYKHTLFWRRS